VGANEVIVPWQSFHGTTSVTIPDPTLGTVALTDPLVLGLGYRCAVLLSQRGFPLGTFSLAMADMKALRKSDG
jgi:hypothetical protein